MMKHNFSFILLTLCFGIISVNAQIAQKITLRSGSILDGYISMQHPGKNFMFAAEKAIISRSAVEIQSIVDHEVNVKELPKDWIEWAEKNDAFVEKNGNRSFTLNDLITSKGIISRVHILERGDKVKYVDLSSNNYSLTWDTIQSVKVSKRPKILLSGINRLYTLSSGMKYEGQYVEEIPGKTVGILDNIGVLQVLDASKIEKFKMFGINSSQSIFQQSEFLDSVVLTNSSCLKGIIIEQNLRM